MNAESDGDKGLRELNHRIYDGNKGTTNGVVAEEHVTLEGDDLKANEIMQNVNDGHVGAVQAPTVLQMPQQQPQNAMCYWQKFLHVTTVTVMLVENDDSTRHVVAALLRNCCYEVIEAANVLQAWKILEDLTKHIDLVLAEVGMPFLSGMVLLSKIMSHRTRKNVPVIMMSSQDSMGLVFKCLSKGAADFLLKPIRKNELKNLWQHVWRRCHSSSGSGSESGTQTQKSVKSKSVDKSDNNTGSNDEDDNGSIGLNVGDGSDDGSGTQTSWTKQAVEADSPCPVSPCDQVAECPDSTCAQVIHSNAEVPGNKWAPVTAARWCQERVEQLDNVAMGKDLDIGMPGNVDLQLQRPVEVPIRAVGTKQINLLEMGSSKIHEQIDKRQLDLNSESSSSKLKSKAANQTGITFTSKTTDLKKESAEYEASKKLFKISDRNETINNSQELSSIVLGLKRLRGVKDAGTVVKDERNVLRRSESSAFSRYNKASNGNKVPIVNIGSSSALDNNLELTRKGSVCDIRSHLVNDLPNQCSNVGSNNIDMGSTTNNAFAKPAVLKNKSVASSTDRSSHPSSAFQSTKSDLLSANQKVVLDKADDVTATAGLAQPRGTHQELQMQHPPHHNDQHHHLAHSLQYQQQPPEHDDLSLKKIAADAPHCGSSSVLGEPIEGNAGNYSVNGSASGSNYGSNGPNGSSTAVNTVGTNISDNGIAGKSGSGHGSKEDQSKSADREAALTKFRQKRKERCFLEKVTNTVGTNISDNGIARKCGSGDASGSGSKEDQSKSADREAALTKFRQKRKERCFRKKVTNTVGTNISDNGIAGKCGSGDASGSGSGSKEDQSKSADREAALTKFLQKRKVRCFRKKVTNTVGTNISDNRIAGKSGRKEDQSKSGDREAALTKFLQKRKERCFRKKVTNTVGTNKSDNGIAGKSGSGDASGSGSGSKEDQSKSAHREAALTKFRQKKKERCFRKKVRYQNRK